MEEGSPIGLGLNLLFLNDISIFTYSFELVILLLLLVASALISGSEIAFFSLDENQLQDCTESKSLAERRIAKMLSTTKNKNKLLATILIMNNLVNVGIVIFSTYIAWQVFGKTNRLIDILIIPFITIFIVFFGEVLPKVFAQQRSLTFAKITANAFHYINWLCTPFSAGFVRVGSWVEQKFDKKGFYPVSIAQINQLLDVSQEQHLKEKEILKGVVNFGQMTARQIMTSRMDMTAIDIETDFHSLLQQISSSGYSRMPIYQGNLDKIVGILYAKDLLSFLDEKSTFAWQDIIRKDPFFVHEKKKINDLFRDFQEKHIHIAMVIDEYGGTLGLVTLEDVIEEIFGEINDEFDDIEESLLFKKLDERNYLFEGKVSLHDFIKTLAIESDFFDEVKGESETLGGLLLEIFKKMPEKGANTLYKQFHFTVDEVSKKRIQRVKVQLQELTPSTEQE